MCIRNTLRASSAIALLLLIMCFQTGCASSYATPGRAADFNAMGLTRDQLTDTSISQTLSKVPLAQFPCGVAAVRVQAPDYHAEGVETWGQGKYCVVTTRDLEGNEFEKLAKLPGVDGIVTLNRLVLPHELNSDMELRQAAANLHADMLLVYTIDTAFNLKDEAEALTVLTLGVSPNQVVHMISTASAVLLDTRNGYVYGFAEATERQDQLANGWGATATIDAARRRTESKAFQKLQMQLDNSWQEIFKKYSKPAA